MSEERRYDDDEVREILDAASEVRPSAPAGAGSDRGLSLSELQEIGREVGLSDDRIAEAAYALDTPKSAPARRTVLGIPFGVGYVTPLPRDLDDLEWEHMVVALRETFGARGRVESYGRIRSWSNSNLQAHVEPSDGGFRLRLQTRKGNALPRAIAGVAFTAVTVVSVLQGGGADVVIPGLVATGLLGSLVVELPLWARRRREQMEALGRRALALIGSSEPDESPPLPPPSPPDTPPR